MAELTKEQIEAAASAYGTAYAANDESYKAAREDGLKAAAPYLQLPWDEPTREEMDAIPVLDDKYDLGYRIWTSAVWLIRRRNKSLLPKPVDPRREKVIAVFDKSVGECVCGVVEYGLLADRILAAIDEVK